MIIIIIIIIMKANIIKSHLVKTEVQISIYIRDGEIYVHRIKRIISINIKLYKEDVHRFLVSGREHLGPSRGTLVIPLSTVSRLGTITDNLRISAEVLTEIHLNTNLHCYSYIYLRARECTYIYMNIFACVCVYACMLSYMCMLACSCTSISFVMTHVNTSISPSGHNIIAASRTKCKF
jgi:hypothetical protein